MTREPRLSKQPGRKREARSSASERPKVLVVEDSPTQAEALLAVLEDRFEPKLAGSGEAAVQALMREQFDIVISDIVMPGKVDGYELCRHIKSGPHADTPVVLLTSLSDPMDIIRGLEAGADNFLTKPYEPQHLLDRLDVLLATRSARTRGRLRTGVAIYFMGRQFTISSEREQILDLLVSTFEDAVRQNRELRQREADLERSRRILRTLYEIAVSLTATTTESEILEIGLGRTVELPSVRSGWIWLFDHASQEFRLAATRDLPPAVGESLGVAGPCYCQREVMAGRLDRVCRVLECERLRAAGGVQQVHASVPLHCGGQMVGVMNLLAEGRESFSDSDLSVLYGVGNQIAFAIERARLWNNMEQLVAQRTAALRAEAAERERAEEALRLSDSILRRVGNLVVVSDRDAKIKYVSPSVEAVLGYSPAELLENGWWDLTFASREESDAERAAVAQTARGEIPLRSKPYERALVARDGRRRLIIWSDSKGPGEMLIGVGLDITDTRQLEEQFRQAQKMEAVGRLAGGVAHDFNNILTAIIGYVDLLLAERDLRSEVRSELDEIRIGADRASRLTRQLLAFSRRQVLQPQPLNLNEVIAGIEPMLRRLLGEDVIFATLTSPDLGTVEADPGQIEQVIMNLALNARDAMPGGGKLTIETRNVVLDESYAQEHAGVSPGNYVLLAVSDTGHGMDDYVRSRVFEPFFTTKPPGMGTGLGLATVYGIVNQSGGHVRVYSEPARGTTMKVYLPRTDRSAVSRQRDEAEPLIGGSEAILVVEDDQSVRSLVLKSLSRLGYSVLEARDGQSALELVYDRTNKVDLLLTDVILPGMSGRAVAQQLLQLQPGAAVLYMSGYTDEAISRQGMLEPGVELLQKPFTPAELAKRVRKVLDARR
ncbi:MAG TPA: response regulator [Gemmatimonadales bacterium]|nr:response regulator [Gemmatimonadales bacterium]